MERIDVIKAKKLIETGEIFRVGFFYCKAMSIEYDRLKRPYLKVKKWLIEPSVAVKRNICNAEGIGFIPLW